MKETIYARYQSAQDQKYLTLTDEELTGEEYELRMLQENNLAAYLQVSVRRFNGDPALWYNISGMQTLEKVYDHRTIDAEALEALFAAVESAITAGEDYLLSAADLVMEPAYIYMHLQRNEFRFVYYPRSGQTQEKPYEVLAEFILKRLRHSDRRALELGYQFYEEASRENFSFTDLMEDIRDGKTQLLALSEDAFPDVRAERRGDYGKETEEVQREIPLSADEKTSSVNVRISPVSGRNVSGTGQSNPGSGGRTGIPAGEQKGRRKGGTLTALYGIIALLLAGVYILLVILLEPDLQTAGGLACAMIAGTVLAVRLIGRKKAPHNNWEEEEKREDGDDLAFMDELMRESYAPDQEDAPARKRA